MHCDTILGNIVIKVTDTNEVRDVLKKAGFQCMGARKGAHEIWCKDGRIVPVSRGSQAISKKRAHQIIKEAGL